MTTHIFSTTETMRECSAAWRAQNVRIGFVPTMGALHAGHAALLKQARAECDKVVCSIFINPTQFGPHEDFQQYPRTWNADHALCVAEGVDAIFAPHAVAEMYPPGDCTCIEVAGLCDQLCGQQRPGHFRGVTTVVYKLFGIVLPHAAYFGEKDFQQCVIIQRMVKDLQLPIDIIPAATVRDADGLALSSRNRYLSAEERRQALMIPPALHAAQVLASAGMATDDLRSYVRREMRDAKITGVDYIEIVDPQTLLPTHNVHGARLCIAVRIGATRLIDNVVL